MIAESFNKFLIHPSGAANRSFTQFRVLTWASNAIRRSGRRFHLLQNQVHLKNRQLTKVIQVPNCRVHSSRPCSKLPKA